jgi:hypothetical protein
MNPKFKMKFDMLLKPDTSIQQIRQLMFDDGLLIRGNALRALGRKIRQGTIDDHENLIEDLLKLLNDTRSEIPIVGLTNIAHLAICCLLKLPIERANQLASNFIQLLPVFDQNLVKNLSDNWDEFISL